MVHTDTDNDEVPTMGTGVRYIVPPVKGAIKISDDPENPKNKIITLFNRMELPTSALVGLVPGDTMYGAVRMNNNVSIPAENLTGSRHRKGKIAQRMSMAREEYLPEIEKYTEDILSESARYNLAVFSVYLNDINLIPWLVDKDKYPVWVDIFEFDKTSAHDPRFVIDPVEIYGCWWDTVGRHLQGDAEVVDLAPIPEDVPYTRDVKQSLRNWWNGKEEEEETPKITEVQEEEEQDQRDEEEEEQATNDEDEDHVEEMKRKYRYIPTSLLKTLPDRIVVDAMTYAFLTSREVKGVQVVQVPERPWTIGHINVTVPKDKCIRLVKNIKKEEGNFRSGIQMHVDLLHEKNRHAKKG